MLIDKGKIVDALRRRGQHDRADWVDRELPDRVDTLRNAGLLATLHLDPGELTGEDPDEDPGELTDEPPATGRANGSPP